MYKYTITVSNENHSFTFQVNLQERDYVFASNIARKEFKHKTNKEPSLLTVDYIKFEGESLPYPYTFQVTSSSSF